MCGIAGIFSFNDEKVDLNNLKKMTDSLVHRGPDGEGHWMNENKSLGLGHRRLSIIDLSEDGKQPMSFKDRYHITYNGELYNYLELKEQLVRFGYEFKSKCDTEVVLACFAEYGEKCLSEFDGMYAFAIWDSVKKELFCARDRFGEKPFFYHYDANKAFTFASEIKAFPKHLKSIDEKMLYNYLQFNVVSLPYEKNRSFYANINSLEPGSFMIVNGEGKLEKKQYWQLKIQTKNISLEDASIRFMDLFQQSIERRLRADVNVGSSLSGGLDSSSIVMMMTKSGKTKSQHTFSARFKDSELDEGEYINEVVQHSGVIGHHTFPDEDSLVDQFEKVFRHQDEPFGSASIFAQWEVMKLAQKHDITVLLDGQGADEILAGYPKYFISFFKQLYKSNRKRFAEELNGFNDLHSQPFKIGIKFILEAQLSELLETGSSLKRQWFGVNNENQLQQDFFRQYRREKPPFDRFNSLAEDLHFSTTRYGLEKLLRYSDRNSMAFSREVRLPFLSHELVEFLFTIPSFHKLHKGWTKHILRHTMTDIVPEKVRMRVDKMGYEPPQKQWLKHNRMQDLLKDSKSLLTQENFITKDSKVTDWQALMAAQLIQNCNSSS